MGLPVKPAGLAVTIGELYVEREALDVALGRDEIVAEREHVQAFHGLRQAVHRERAIVARGRELCAFCDQLELWNPAIGRAGLVDDDRRAVDERARCIDDPAGERAAAFDADRADGERRGVLGDVDVDRVAHERPADDRDAAATRRNVGDREAAVTVTNRDRNARMKEDAVLGDAKAVLDDAAGDRRGARGGRQQEHEDEQAHATPGRQPAPCTTI
jgi:hypothetical protein